MAKVQSFVPPLGIMPKFVWLERRYKDILDGINRFTEAGKDIPLEWITEKNEIKEWLNSNGYAFVVEKLDNYEKESIH